MIILDAGHGGYDPGAVGPRGSQEAAICKAICLKIGAYLTAQGVAWDLTPEEGQQDSRTELNKVCAWMAMVRPELSISVHCNSAADPSAHGVETYCYSLVGEGYRLAAAVNRNLVATTGLTDRGVKTANFAMTRTPYQNGWPGILVEMAFISNDNEEAMLINDAWQDKIAQAIGKGIMEYMGIDELPKVKTSWDLEKEAAAVWVRDNKLSDGERPDAPLTRGEFFAILRRYHAARGNV